MHPRHKTSIKYLDILESHSAALHLDRTLEK
jgi:hypothetical protein